jgi:hypothetical protein
MSEQDDKKWGHCRNCRFFASPARVPFGSEEARCEQPTLSKFRLTVYGSCGCNAWELRMGLPETVEEQRTTTI